MRILLTTFLALLLSLPQSAFTQSIRIPVSADLPRASIPSLVHTLQLDETMSFCGEKVPVDIPHVRERLEKQVLLNLWDRAQMILYMKRSGRFFPYIESELAKRGMPDDLKYLAVIESALRPHAGSSAGAVGYWQFIRPTAKKYGLRVDKRIDDRRNIFTSTQAALDYLTDLHDEFDSWAVAAAAYNMGENGMRKRIRTQEVREYYRLSLPLETENYVFRALAVKLIMSDPNRFGFYMTDEDYYQPHEFERVRVKLTSDVSLTTLAKAGRTYFKALKELNTHILGNELVKGDHILLVPEGGADGFHGRLKGRLRGGVDPALADRTELLVYVVRPGDTLTAIAKRHGVKVGVILKQNNIRKSSKIRIGQKLIIPR